MSAAWSRTLVIALVAIAFGLWLTNQAVYQSIALAIVGVVVVLVVILVFRARRRRLQPTASDQLYASDEYSDLQLGRRRTVQPHRDVRETSQIGDGLAPDPLPLRRARD